jgi:hypothetical protein
MSKITPRLFSIAFCLSLVSCDTATPENYFDRAVLNCNLMHGFAGSGLRRELEGPSVKLSETGNGETIPMKRKEVIDNAITSLETNFEKVKKLKVTDDTRDILQASIALYEFVLPVYNTEYQQLARLYDEGAAQEETIHWLGPLKQNIAPTSKNFPIDSPPRASRLQRAMGSR